MRKISRRFMGKTSELDCRPNDLVVKVNLREASVTEGRSAAYVSRGFIGERREGTGE